MFGIDFYPTPLPVIEQMLEDININGKTILEPSAGKGNIVDYILNHGGEVIACEKDADLRKILATKCAVIANDFLTLESQHISHVHMIVMNPPFSNADGHIMHAWEIAPAGCQIIALCNSNTLDNDYSRTRKELNTIISSQGSVHNLGQCFTTAERKTEVDVSLIRLSKPGSSYDAEFEGFFMDEDPPEQQAHALMPYNFIRDLVNRYVAAVKIFDEQLNTARRMNELTSQFYKSSVAMSVSKENEPIERGRFKKDLQKSAWNFIFNKMDMNRIATKGLQEDINKFVEQQTQIPFTMRNVYRMLDIVIATTEQRMDKALLEVFDKVTKHYSDNRFNVEGWKTNSHYVLNRKFIMPNVVTMSWSSHLRTNHYGWADPVNDLYKALCFLTGKPYEGGYDPFGNFLDSNKVEPGTLNQWGFFEFRAFKKGTVHFTFLDEDVWAMFNQRIAKINGFPLPESMKKKTPEPPKPEPAKPKPQARKQEPDDEPYTSTDPSQLGIFEAILELC
jgi:hypothetical protein